MKFILILCLISVSVTLGHALKCYFSIESKIVNTARLEIPCLTPCAKSSAPLPDGSSLTMRACVDTFEKFTDPETLSHLTPDQRDGLRGVNFANIHSCRSDLCNSAHSVVATSLLPLLISAIVTAFAVY
ncbi:uncharacterized protein [Fopius arisanus]|uniref:Uncharacterized protein n=1 Tax=Fopius arisanus TaxID=64838 RepID=A0A9R1T675_9HYME|nr:PREDICTED: uncharacterized protein LOC105266871 [Fopius arisanus]